MTGLDPRRRAVAAWTLLVARAVYAFNWYDIGGVLPLVGSRFGIGTVDRGLVLVAFLLGAAIFQLPAGFAAMRWGSRSTSVVALGAMAVFSVGSAFSSGWILLALFRFGVGAGAAFFFAPALELVTRYYPGGDRGFMIGGYNAAFSVGSGIGLFASAYLGSTAGWAWPLELGGWLLLGTTLAAAALLPRLPSSHGAPAGDLGKASRPVLTSRSLWAVAVGGAGLWAGFYIAAQYFVNFAHSAHAGWSLALAAAAPTVMIALEVPGGPIGGWFGERSRDMRRSLVAWGLLAAVLIAVVPWLPLPAAVGAFAVIGFADGVTFALLYLLPTYLPELRGNVVALGLGLINSVQIFLGSAVALVFAYVADAEGYGAAWIFAGAATAVFLPFLALAARRPTPGAAPARPA